jgi:diacylglycerol kinase (ATP)
VSERTEADPQPEPTINPGRVVDAFRYSAAGFAAAWRTEGSFRLEVIAAAILLPVACFAPVTALERVALAGSVLLVIAIELLNCSVEAAIDRISLERHPLSKIAKDTGSAAVMVAVLIAVIAWLSILGPPVLQAIR